MTEMKKYFGTNIIHICFIICISLMLGLPFLMAHRYLVEEDISVTENRMLAEPTALIKDGRFHKGFPSEYDRWFSDHMGFRNIMINLNAWMDYYLFGQFPDSTNNKVGKTGEIVDGRPEMVKSFAHTNLDTREKLEKTGDALQVISDWVESQNAQFYAVQCVEKHEIYPETFLDGVNQIGNTSKEDQWTKYVSENTNVKMLYLKDVLEQNKEKYHLYNKWTDAAHWNPRGAYIGYREIMNFINQNGNSYDVLDESDYNIEWVDAGETYYGRIHKEDRREEFTILQPKAKELPYIADIDGMIDDPKHSVWENKDAGNEDRLLILGDSYVYCFIIDDFAESFSNTWMVMNDYLEELPDIMEQYQPDIVILECAQRVNYSGKIRKLAQRLQNEQ